MTISRKTKKGILATALSAAMAISCGIDDNPCRISSISDATLHGTYAMTYQEKEDFYDMLNPPYGTYEMEITTLGSNDRLSFEIKPLSEAIGIESGQTLGVYDFDRNPETGEVCKSWRDNGYWAESYGHSICGTITDYGEVSLEASVDTISNGSVLRIAIDTWGCKRY